MTTPSDGSTYLSKRGYVLKKDFFTQDQLFELKKELRGRPLIDAKFNKNALDSTYPVYIETKNKLYIPKMFGINKFGFPDTVLENYQGKIWDHPIEFNGQLYDRQKAPCDALYNSCIENNGGVLTLGTGFGKCHGINTPIMMYDGSIKMVQDIKVGDFLMGDDSTPRKVLSLARGEDEMYDIIPVKGDKYTVNQEHILCLQISGKPSIRKGKNSKTKYEFWEIKWFENNKFCTKFFPVNKQIEAFEFHKNTINQKIMEISVKNYIKLSNNIKHILKGYKVPIEFDNQEIPIDPYIIGLWLGDGHSYSPGFTNQDSSIIKYLKENLSQYNCYLSCHKAEYAYYISGLTGKYNSNFFLTSLQKLNLIKNKHIPMIYKCNSRENRLKLLAGLIDSDGNLDNSGVGLEFCQSLEHEKIIDDTVYLARSLGFSCYKSKKQTSWTYKGIKKYSEAWRISISGNTDIIPTLIPRKKAKKRRQIKNVLVTGLKVEHVGKDKYYGFTLDQNNRYLMGDFTVTHNTVCGLNVLARLKGKTIIVVNKITLLNQWKSEIEKFLPNASIGILQGQKKVDIIDKDITIAMLQSLSRIDYPDELFKEFSVTVIDEIHNVSSEHFSKILFKLCSKYTIGLSATPTRSDGCEYVFKWHIGDIVYRSSVDRVGKPPIIKCLKITSSEYKEVCSVNRFTGQKQIQFTSMLTELIEIKKRNDLIIELVKDCIKHKRKILVLSDRRNHLSALKTMIDTDTRVTFTSGLFVGSMKIEDLDKSKACDVILATFAAFGEGVSEKDLDTLILCTPKKFIGHLKNTTKNESGKLEQIIGRIFRKDHLKLAPLIIDLQDHFSVYKNQSTGRKKFYKEHFKNAIYQEQNVDLDTFTSINDIITKKITEVEEPTQPTNLITKFCLLDDD